MVDYIGFIVLGLVIAGAIRLKQFMLKAINEPKEYPDYLLKLSMITDKKQYDLFVIAGEECNIPVYLVKRDWETYIKTGTMPTYMTDFLDEGKEYIDEVQILK